MERISLTVHDGLADLTLTRADARNAIDMAWVEGLVSATDALAAHDGLRAVLITAEGPAFTVGGDLAHLQARLDDLPNELNRMVTPFHRALAAIAELPVPVVCAAHGAVAGGGLGLLWCSDVVLLAEGCKLATGFSRLGLSGDGGSTWYLPRLVGLRRAIALQLEGRVLDAAEAVQWGLASRVVRAEDLSREARATALHLAAGPTTGYGEMRRLLRGALDRDLREGLDAERRAMGRCGATADALEGVAAFMERRDPSFTGR